MLFVPADRPVKSYTQLLDSAKAQPGPLSSRRKPGESRDPRVGRAPVRGSRLSPGRRLLKAGTTIRHSRKRRFVRSRPAVSARRQRDAAHAGTMRSPQPQPLPIGSKRMRICRTDEVAPGALREFTTAEGGACAWPTWRTVPGWPARRAARTRASRCARPCSKAVSSPASSTCGNGTSAVTANRWAAEVPFVVHGARVEGARARLRSRRGR
jgi:hypothetical protein